MGLFKLIGGWLGGVFNYVAPIIPTGPGNRPSTRTFTVAESARSFRVSEQNRLFTRPING
jgi:hypothetical protein